jgi:NAD(P)H-dependent FMN reductase
VTISDWIAVVGREVTGGDFEVVDLKAWPLPMDDEAGLPQGGAYGFEHTLAWSRKIAAASAFVFVTPQYNGGYPAPLKNAIDHLYGEWAGKPAMIVSYGGRGGGYASEQLQQVLRFVQTTPLAIRPALTVARDRIEANDGQIDPATAFAAHLGDLREAFGQFAAALAGTQPIPSA